MWLCGKVNLDDNSAGVGEIADKIGVLTERGNEEDEEEDEEEEDDDDDILGIATDLIERCCG